MFIRLKTPKTFKYIKETSGQWAPAYFRLNPNGYYDQLDVDGDVPYWDTSPIPISEFRFWTSHPTVRCEFISEEEMFEIILMKEAKLR